LGKAFARLTQNQQSLTAETGYSNLGMKESMRQINYSVEVSL